MFQYWAIKCCNICGINIGFEIYYSKEDMCGLTDKNIIQYDQDKLLQNVLRVFQTYSVGLK